MPFSLIPKHQFHALSDITPAFLQAHHIRWLLMDFDNTIVPYIENEPTKAICDWIDTMKNSGIHLCIVSNTKRRRAPDFGERYGIFCITHAKKPFSKGIRAAQRQYGFYKNEAALVGDQIYTDVLGANCAGIQSILVTAINNHNIWLKLRHMAELPFIWVGKVRLKHEKRGKI